MDLIRAKEARIAIHSKATNLQKAGDFDAAEKVYREALLIYPNKPGMILGLAGTLALKHNYAEAIELIEQGLPLSKNEKQKATMRAVLCFLYLATNNANKARRLAGELPHQRECREVILPLIASSENDHDIHHRIKRLILGE